MKSSFTHKTNYFKPILATSLIGHFIAVSGSAVVPHQPQVAVINAPSSIEVKLVEEYVVPDPINLVEPMEEIIIAEESPVIEEVIKVKEIKEEIQEVNEEKIVEESSLSQGAYTEAKPLKIKNPAPIYPQLAKRRGWEGLVIIEVEVNAMGLVDRLGVGESSGYSVFDQEALKTVKTWQFEPAYSNGKAYASTIQIPIKFELVN